MCLTASLECSVACAASSPPIFESIDPLPGYSSCVPQAISGDGTTVVGLCWGPSNEAFVWNAEKGSRSLGFLPGTDYSVASAVSSDGSVIVGRSGRHEPEEEYSAFRWTKGEGMQELTVLPGYSHSNATAVSADGQVVAGNTHSMPSSDLRGFRWTAAEGMTVLGSLTPNPPETSRIEGISADGIVLVGVTDPNELQRSIRWTVASGMQSIYSPAGTHTVARAASANGSIIVGGSQSSAFRWSAATGSADAIPNMQMAFSISADGTVIVGREVPISEHIAKVWTQPCGTRVLKDLLLQAGLPEVEDWKINIAYDIADDNRTIVGLATNPQGQQRGFVARLPRTGDVNFDGVVNPSDLIRIIESWGPCAGNSCIYRDMNCDGMIEYVDLLAVINNWG